MESDRHVIDDVGPVLCVVAQRFEIARPNARDEKVEVAAEIVDARNARAADEVFDRCSLTRWQGGEHALQRRPHGYQLAQQRRREAWRPRRPHITPAVSYTH